MVTLLVDLESVERQNKALKRRLTQAKLRQKASVEDIDFQSGRGIKKSPILSLSTCNWIKEHHNVLITGATGVGKSFMACALGHKACIEGYRVRYFRLGRLFREMIGNPTIADAVMDRLIHNAYHILLKGESMRKKKKQSNMN